MQTKSQSVIKCIFIYLISRKKISLRAHFCKDSGGARSAVHRCSIKSWAEIIHKIHRKIPVIEPRFNKVAGCKSTKSLKRDSDTGVFL